MQLIRQSCERRTIQKYGGGGFTIGDGRFAGSVLILPDGVTVWPVTTFANLSEGAFDGVLKQAPAFDVCLLGCGPRVARLPAALRTYLSAAGLQIEPMETGAACRTFNVLAAEGRALAAALIAI